MAKTPFADLPIYTFAPLQEGQPFLALIDKCPLIFKGATPFSVHMMADAWRKKEIAKHEKAAENAARRVEAARAARITRETAE